MRIAVFLLLACPMVWGQTDRVERVLLVADLGSRALDVYSTRRSLSEGNHEMFLPGIVANHTVTMTAYSAGSVALDWWITRKLERHGHRRIARIITAIDLAQDAPWAVRNLFVHRETDKIALPSVPIPVPYAHAPPLGYRRGCDQKQGEIHAR